MRWLMFIILALLAVVIQTAIGPRVELLGARPDWLLVVVVFIALYAPDRDALLGAWALGGCADLMTIERFGLIALSYGLVAVAIVGIRGYLFRDRWLTQFMVTLCACVLVRVAWLAYRRIMFDPAASLAGELLVETLFVSLYTAMWAPVLHSGLGRIDWVLGLSVRRVALMGSRARRLRGV